MRRNRAHWDELAAQYGVYAEEVPLPDASFDWAQRWPSEEVWKARRR